MIDLLKIKADSSGYPKTDRINIKKHNTFDVNIILNLPQNKG